MNIYITQTNEDLLRSYDGSMSGLVNRLLEDFFVKNPSASTGGKKPVEYAALPTKYPGEALNIPQDTTKETITPVAIQRGDTIILSTREIEQAKSALKPRVCKNGHPIPYPKDRCLGKGCKYA